MQIVLKTDPSPEDVNAVRTPLIAFNTKAVARERNYHPFAFHVVEDGKVVGGATGHGSLDWVFLELLFVPENMRGQGVGSALLGRVETFARDHGMIGVWLDTFSFQARPFYERQGYSVVGTIADYPVGGACYFMSKRLDGAAATA